METNFVIVLIFVHNKKQKAMQNLHANVLLNLPFIPFFSLMIQAIGAQSWL
jgi:hypothetical protein